ncbi:MULTISPECIES: family 43 glycosylhydrolase [unclassified Paenibacillus]|uniref:family 43 glycosylhydrolase n=1 Tax=unclassified Paenibacillus TaxID=185978 RepID=UPI00104A08D6|nr:MULTISPECIES: family 43 glycosylhydrolase [unclassified Paenibacillus]NIK68261.1 GH43 family beta-xylosidase [Paenibacillus sp. BK720]TCM99524.1 GH43 family beta-xylosidase [Paenibacillus sp. BK033]
MNPKRWAVLTAAVLLVTAAGIGVWAMKDNANEANEVSSEYNGHGGTFKNTLAEIDTPDPAVVYKDGYYYMTFTHNGADVMVMKSRTIDFKQAERKVVWYPDIGTNYSAELWAPEIQFLQGKWYIYFAADDGLNENHRMFALEADTDDPMGSYTFKGQVKDDTDKWAIDGLAMELNDKLYFVWSGWEGDINVQQNTYIAPMSDPLTISGPRVLLSEPDLEWEKAGGPPYINEGHSILRHNGQVHIVYSGAGSWTPFYALGMLSLKEGADPLVASNWTKAQEPILKMDEDAGVYGPGHNSFVTSPDGTEQWIVYHATTAATDGWANRKARAQKLTWDEAGKLQVGNPLSLDTAIEVPAGMGVFKAAAASADVSFDLIPSAIHTTAPLLIHYRNDTGEQLQANVSVNGEQGVNVGLPETSGTGYAYADISLAAGINEIRIAIVGGQGKIEAIELPRYEAEYASAGTQGEAEENLFSSAGGKVVVGPGEGDALRFANIQVPASGDYEIRLAAANSSGQEAELQIRVDGSGSKAKKLVFPDGKRNNYQTQSVILQLKAGKNAIILENATAEVHVDYMDILRSSAQ